MTLALQETRPLSLLLVEDDGGDAKAIQRSFQKAQIANPIQWAMDGQEALEILKGTNGKAKLPSPSILIVDLNMPRMSGMELLAAIREDRDLRQSVVFMLTTSTRQEDKMAAYDLNVSGYIVKETAGLDFANLVNLMDCYWRIVEMP